MIATCIRLLPLFGAIALLAGCSTIPRRIEERRTAFESFPPDVKKNVRGGTIEVGYTKDMVYIAKGSPDEIHTRETETGETTIWSYTRTYYPRTAIGLHYGPYGRHHYQGFYHHSSFWWGGYGERRFEHLRIEWDGDRVKAVERSRRSRGY